MNNQHKPIHRTTISTHVRDQMSKLILTVDEYPEQEFTSLGISITGNRITPEITFLCAGMTKSDMIEVLNRAVSALTRQENLHGYERFIKTDKDVTTEYDCDWCGRETDNGNGHYLDELGVEDRVCGDCYRETTII